MKKRFLTLIVASLIATLGVSLTGCKGEQSSTLPYISSKDEIYYATDDMPEETQPVTAETKSKNTKNSVNPDADQIAEDATYPTIVANNSSSSNNINPNASSFASNSSSKTSSAITLSSTAVDLKIGQSKSINVSVNLDETNTSSYYAETSNDNISISCSGSKITITGKKAGNATVIVKSGNKKASCNVIILGNKTVETTKNITDDTEVEYKELCTDYYQAKITSGVNIDFYNDGNGSVYKSSLKKGEDQTTVIEVSYSKLKDKKTSINALVKDLRKQFESDMEKNDDSEEFDIKNYRINCYSEKQSNGEYTIYFCYQKL
ncbi:MAG: hypothetical protein J1E85_03145 [Ruminococcus sp.]|nr:hypothetical protein [Ruminococcus sp.]